MYIKLIGSLCVIVAASGYGYSRGLEYKKRVETLDELRRIIWEIQGEIAYTRAPLEEICLRVQRRVKEPYKSWLFSLAGKLERKGNSVLGTLWKEAAKEHLDKLVLSEEDRDELMSMGEQMGYLDIRMQEEVFVRYGRNLEEKGRKLEAELEEKRKLCGCLGVMGGMALSLLLI